MLFDLTANEIRVLCTLIEKAEATPDQYPMGTSPLRNACNQKTSRDPVTELTETEVEAALLSLRERGAARSVRPTGARGWKHRHTIEEVLAVNPGEIAILAVLGLRGAQTPGELRQRTDRIHQFESVEAVEAGLQSLASREEPLVESTGRQPGQSQDRWVQLLGSQATTPKQNAQRVLSAEFATLHEAGFFAMPNPWNRLSAQVMERAGAKALATSSAALAAVLGKDDYEISRDELVHHVEDLTSHVHIPVHVDGERLFGDASGGIAETVAQLADAGAAGVSIEDFDPATHKILAATEATEAVAIAADACRKHHMLLTARCENHLYGHESLDDTIQRLQAYAEAGAGCVYAPGLTDAVDIELVVEEVGVPVNVLALPNAPDNRTLAALGVRRASSGSQLFNELSQAMVDKTHNFLRTD